MSHIAEVASRERTFAPRHKVVLSEEPAEVRGAISGRLHSPFRAADYLRSTTARLRVGPFCWFSSQNQSYVIY